jgi:ATP phosphoribosyltransferase regulatory subunit
MNEVESLSSERRALRIAVPKGELFDGSVSLLARAGLDTTTLADPGRQLVISAGQVEYYILRPSDVPVFAAHGGVDCAICGKDTLVELGLDIVELADLKFGACRFIVAEQAGSRDAVLARQAQSGVLRVASKYPHITEQYYAQQGVQIELIVMHGNIELAPLVGMADRIVDITATGRTLRENNLIIVDEVMHSTARFIANPASVRVDSRVYELADLLIETVGKDLVDAS